MARELLMPGSSLLCFTAVMRLCLTCARPSVVRNTVRSSCYALPVSPFGRTHVLSDRRVLRLASMLTRQLTFLRNPMAAHGVPRSMRGCVGASCMVLLSAMFVGSCVSQRIRWRPSAGRRAVTRYLLVPALSRSPVGGISASAPRFRSFDSLWRHHHHARRTSA